jgi:hypothetical protein
MMSGLDAARLVAHAITASRHAQDTVRRVS